jgi:hypothetical protein
MNTLKEVKASLRIQIREAKSVIKENKKYAEGGVTDGGFYQQSSAERLVETYETRLEWLNSFYEMIKDVKKIK